VRRGALLLLLAALCPGLALAADGRQVFETRCAGCHAAAPGAPPGAGPTLAGVLGRRVAGDAAFDYSPALLAARDAGQAWDGPLLQRFLADPEDMFPGLWMGANGLREAADRAAVAAFLAGTARPD
jgi:cytochrome c